MRTTSWVKLETAVPLDKVAARVTRQGPGWYTPASSTEEGEGLQSGDWKTPKGEKNLFGTRIGKLTVIGFFRKVHPARMNLWIVLCECGAQELRRQRWVLNPKAEHEACCRVCRAVYLQ